MSVDKYVSVRRRKGRIYLRSFYIHEKRELLGLPFPVNLQDLFRENKAGDEDSLYIVFSCVTLNSASYKQQSPTFLAQFIYFWSD